MRNQPQKCNLLCFSECQQKCQKLIDKKIEKSNFEKLSLKKVHRQIEQTPQLIIKSQSFKNMDKAIPTTDRSNFDTNDRNFLTLRDKKEEIQNQLVQLNKNIDLFTQLYNVKLFQLRKLNKQLNSTYNKYKK